MNETQLQSRSGHVLYCHDCGAGQRVYQIPGITSAAFCFRCDGLLRSGPAFRRSKVLAFALSATLLLVPANFLPFMSLRYFGRTTTATIWESVVSMVQSGSWFIAVVVALASIVFPVLKVLFLLVLCFWNRTGLSPKAGTKLYRVTETLGRWAMLDVFILAIVVCLLKFDTLADAAVQPGAIAFLGVVIMTLLASSSFDPKSLWENYSE